MLRPRHPVLSVALWIEKIICPTISFLIQITSIAGDCNLGKSVFAIREKALVVLSLCENFPKKFELYFVIYVLFLNDPTHLTLYPCIKSAHKKTLVILIKCRIHGWVVRLHFIVSFDAPIGILLFLIFSGFSRQNSYMGCSLKIQMYISTDRRILTSRRTFTWTESSYGMFSRGVVVPPHDQELPIFQCGTQSPEENVFVMYSF